MENKTVDKNINEIKVRKPIGIIYYPVLYLLKLVSKILFCLKIDKKGLKGLKAPYLVLANHASVVDIVFTLGAFLPQRLNIVTSKDLFTWKLFKPFIDKLGCIPKSQLSIDIMAIKTMKAALEQGRCVALYSEGRTSLDGKELHYVPDNIGKLVKMLDAPVAFSHLLGAYLTKPRFFKGLRFGKIKLTAKVLLTVEEVRSLSVKEISDRIREALKFNDHIYQRENKIKFRTNHMADRLNYILYKCPKCGAEYEMESTKTQLICKACGNTVTYTQYGELIPDEGSVSFDRVDQWYDYQRECIDKEIAAEDFRISKPVEILEENERDFSSVGEGELYIDKDFIGVEGTVKGQPFSRRMPLRITSAIITKNEEGVDFYFADGFYRCLFTEKKYSSKYGLIVEQSYRKKMEEAK